MVYERLDVNRRRSNDDQVEYLGKAWLTAAGWRCMAIVFGELCLVEVDITKEPPP